MTDGLQNTPPSIESVSGSLQETSVCSIGFGIDANLNGFLLSQLAADANGLYTRANSGLELKKFFVLCFGNIFNENIAFDPFDCIPTDKEESEPIYFNVCDEKNLTVVAGWEGSTANLEIKLISPSGMEYTKDTLGVESAFGETYTFVRVKLPFQGESEGTWRAILMRSGPRGPDRRRRLAPVLEEVCYFLASLVQGGPELHLALKESGKTYYTGDVLIPTVALQSPEDAVIGPATVKVAVSRPDVAAGEILLTNDVITAPSDDWNDGPTSPRRDALRDLQAYLTYVDEEFDLVNHDHHVPIGPIEPTLVFWNTLDIAKFEGEYTFHAIAQYGREGQGCTGRRELTWSLHVDVGIDPDNTDVDITIMREVSEDGWALVRFTFTPKDRLGNRLGPWRVDAFNIMPAPGTTIIEGSLSDNYDGSYSFNAVWDQKKAPPYSVHDRLCYGPRIILKQKGREAIFIGGLLGKPGRGPPDERGPPGRGPPKKAEIWPYQPAEP